MSLLALLPISAIVLAVLGVMINTPVTVKRNDARIRRRDSNLAQWVHDDDVELSKELRRLTNSMAADGHLYSGSLVSARQSAKNSIRNRYRDQLTQANQSIEDVELEERAWHRTWRRIASKPLPGLDRQEDQAITDILARWDIPETGAAVSLPGPGIPPGAVKPATPYPVSATAPFGA